MKIFTFIALSLAAPALVAVSGCDEDDDPGSAGTGTAGRGGSGGTGGRGGSGGTGGGGGAGPGQTMGRLRVVHLSPDAPAVDVCVNPGSGFIGPVLAGAGDSDGLAYSEATGYVPVPAATYSVRIVAPGSANCNTALGGLPDVVGVAVAANSDYTAAAVGMLTPAGGDEAFAIKLMADDNTPANAAKAYLRFVHASPDTPAVDVGTGTGSSFTAVWTGVDFGEVGQVGGGSYLETDPLTDATVSARATGTTTDTLVIPGVDLPAGVVATAFAIGNLDGAPQPLKVLVCQDTAATATCAVVP